LDRTYIKIVASICLVASGLLIALLLLSSGKVAADVDLVAKTSNIKFTVNGQDTTTPTVNDVVNITITVVNQGTNTNASNFYVRFQNGAVLINNLSVTKTVVYGGGMLNVSTLWTAAGPGSHTINVIVDPSRLVADSNWSNNQASKNLDVNIAPHAVLNVDQNSALTLVNFNCNSTGSTDADGNIVSYFWAFGDGSFANTAATAHAYTDEGSYTISLLITDNDGGTNNTKKTVTVTNRAPIARAIGSTVLTYTNVWFDAANSTDADGSIVNMTWYINGPNVWMYGKKASYMFTQNAIYTVTLTVKDDDGATNNTNLFITVKDRPPVASIIANRTKINTTDSIQFDGSQSSDKDGSIANYTWIFPNSVVKYGPKLSYKFNLPNGSYQVTLVVTDDDGSLDFTSLDIKIGNKRPVVNPGLDVVAMTFDIITFDGSDSYDPDGSIVNFTWDMGDGGKRYNSTFQYYYQDDGTYTVRLTVIDNEGAVNSSTIKVRVMNRPPTAYHSPVLITTYEKYWFNTSECTDRDGYIASVSWVFHDSGGAQNTINTNTTYFWKVNGTYLVKMTITDDDGLVAAYSFNVTVMNSNPWAIFTYNPTTGLSVGDSITFDASQSKDVDGNIVNWVWLWGDGSPTTGSGEITQHAYKIAGLFKIELRVIDNSGGSNSTFKMVLIAPKNTAPVPMFSINAPDRMTNRSIGFDATGSYDPDGFIMKYIWDFGDLTTGSGKTVIHKYTQSGSYTVKLTVEDNGTKQNSTTQSLIISVAPNLPPVAIINTNGQTQVIAGVPMIFDGRASNDADGTIVNYTWDFGDGTYKYSAYVTKAFAETSVGTMTVKLTVRDNMGAPTTAQVTITVLAPPKKDIPPNAQFSMTPAGPVQTGTEVTFDAGQSSDPDGSITGYTWLFGDGSFAQGRTVTHTYSTNQVFLIVLTVIDNAGSSGTTSKDMTVTDRPPVAVIKVSKDSPLSQESVTFDASGSSDPDGYLRSYTWIFGDEKVTKTGKIVTYYSSSPGNLKVILKVLDDDGSMGTTEMTLKIGNRQPIANAGGDQTVLEEATITLDGSQSKDTDGTVTEWLWTATGLSSSSLNGKITTISKAPTLAKGETQHIYTVTLQVQDNNGLLSNTTTISITVMKKPVPPKNPVVKQFIPGFDMVVAVAAMSVVVSVLAFRKRRKA